MEVLYFHNADQNCSAVNGGQWGDTMQLLYFASLSDPGQYSMIFVNIFVFFVCQNIKKWQYFWVLSSVYSTLIKQPIQWACRCFFNVTSWRSGVIHEASLQGHRGEMKQQKHHLLIRTGVLVGYFKQQECFPRCRTHTSQATQTP